MQHIVQIGGGKSPHIRPPRYKSAEIYHQLVESAREWPVDAANLLRFLVYLFLGLGSWLGGAVVERVLDDLMRG